jgi:MinD-like ATPase involved in chromosome partitioning or flagellar assembly
VKTQNSTQELNALLTANPLFAGLTPALREELTDLFVPRSYEAGELIFRVSEPAHDYFMMLAGKVHLRLATMPVARRIRGDGFGELGLVPGTRRRAETFAGRGGCWVAKLPRLALERLMEENLEAFEPFREALATRLEPLGVQLREYSDRSCMVGSPRVIAFGAPRDGVGRTTLAVNFASLLAIEGLRVALVDLDPTGGDVSLLTGVEPIRNWTGLFPARGAPGDLSPATLREFLLPAGADLHVLPAPPHSESARGPTPDDVESLIRALARAYDAVILDAPSGSGRLAQVTFRCADLGVVVGNYSYQGVFALNRTLAGFARAGIRGPHVQVVLNRLGRADDIPKQEEETLLRPALAHFQEEDEVARAAAQGKPDVLARPSGKLAASLQELRTQMAEIRRQKRTGMETRDERRARGRSLTALGRSLFLQGDHVEALRHLEESAVALPEDPEAAVLVGRILEDRGDLRAAGEWFRLALECDSENLHALCRGAFVTRNPVLLAKGKALLTRGLERYPSRADYHLLRGLLLEVEEQPELAEESFQEALALNPTYSEVHRRRGDLAERQGRPDLALEFLRQATRTGSLDPAAWDGLSRVLHGLGLVGPAFQAVRQLIRLVPDHPPGLKRQQALTQGLRRVRDEVVSYDRALVKNEFPDVLLLRAGARIRQGDLRSASLDAARALELGAGLPGARLLLRKLRNLKPLLSDVDGDSLALAA